MTIIKYYYISAGYDLWPDICHETMFCRWQRTLVRMSSKTLVVLGRQWQDLRHVELWKHLKNTSISSLIRRTFRKAQECLNKFLQSVPIKMLLRFFIITHRRKGLGSKVRPLMEHSGDFASADGHWNFAFWPFGRWEYWV